MTAGLSRSQSGVLRGELPRRIASAFVLVVVAVAATLAGGWPAVLLIAVLSAVLFVEWFLVTGRGRPRAWAFFGCLALSVAIVLFGVTPVRGAGLAALAVVAAATVAAAFRDRWLSGGILYASAFGLALIALRSDPGLGIEAVLFVFVVVWMTDIGAYAAGRLIGGPKLWPRISPKKTWAGSVGGAVAGTVSGLAVAGALGIEISAPLVLIAFVLTVAAEAGDLFESAVKRRFGVKDAEFALIPGHGGLMDRVDGLIFAGVAAALIGWVHAGPGAVGRGVLAW